MVPPEPPKAEDDLNYTSRRVDQLNLKSPSTVVDQTLFRLYGYG